MFSAPILAPAIHRRDDRASGAGLPGGRGPRGFSLLEVLVALAVFALTAIVLGSAYLNILNSYEVVARNSVVGEDIAFARQLVLTEPDRLKLEKGGEFETAAGRRAQWRVEITSTMMADLFTVIFTCEVSDPNRPEPDRITQTFTLLRPTWSVDVAERDKLRQDTRTRILELQQKKA